MNKDNCDENKLNDLLLDYQDSDIDDIVNHLGYNSLYEAITDSNFVTRVNAFVKDYKHDNLKEYRKDKNDK